jgi:hypothetical protein
LLGLLEDFLCRELVWSDLATPLLTYASLSYPYCKDLPEHLLGRELAWSDLATPLLSPPASLSYPYCKDLLEDVLGRGLAWRDLATRSSLLRIVELSFPLDCIQRELLVTATSCYACFNQSSLR